MTLTDFVPVGKEDWVTSIGGYEEYLEYFRTFSQSKRSWLIHLCFGPILGLPALKTLNIKI